MQRLLCGLGSLLALGLATPSASAQWYSPPPCCCYPSPYLYGGYPPGPRLAPDMCGSYYYCNNGCQWYGPNYCVRPPFEPFNGILPGQGMGGPGSQGMPSPNQLPPPPTPMQYAAQKGYAMPGYGPRPPYGPGPVPPPPQVALPINPWTRSPRDFFMWGEAQQEQYTRETRPRFVP